MPPLPEHRLLVIDDNPAIHDDFRKILVPPLEEAADLAEVESLLFGAAEGNAERGPRWEFAYSLSTASQGQEGVQLVKNAAAEGNPFSVAFVDMRMPPGWDGVETVTHLWRADPSVQIVICTAYSDYSWEEMRRRLGGSDNLLILKKPFDNVEVLQLAASLTRKWDLNQQARLRIEEMERVVAERTAELRHSEERFSTAFRAAPLPQAIITWHTGQVVDANEAFLQMVGYSVEELRHQSAAIFEQTGLLVAMKEIHPLRQRETEIRHQSGETVHALLSTQPTQVGQKPHLLLMAQDVTRNRALAEQLRHAQKMEAVGQLAAGVAHDFNNILTIIQGHLSAQLAYGHFETETRQALAETLQASERAAVLTRQLLTFSRKHLFQPEALDLGELLGQQIKLLRRIIGEQINLVWDGAAEGMPHVLGDAASIEQAVMNLAINSRDAMPTGGILRISSEAVLVDEAQAASNPEAKTGGFIRLRVTDSGCGMDQTTLRRIFEPFFTTKDVGQGTGMGLATVYGILKQHGGWIDVESEVGRGTRFSLYLPIAAANATSKPAAKKTGLTQKVSLRVLLVEDEPAVRAVMKMLLLRCGCQVVEACDAHQGYRRWTQHKERIDLLVTDIVMPGGVSGHDLARQLLLENPELKVIYCSGYSAELFKEKSELIPGQNFLQKPYDASSVVDLLVRVADQKKAA